MARFRDKDRFLKWLNEDVVIRRDADGEHTLEERPDVERRSGGGQLVLPTEHAGRLVWAVECDVVLEGACADMPSGYDEMGRRYDEVRYPMGFDMRHADEPEDAPRRSWLHKSLRVGRHAEAINITVFAGCCNSYPQEYRELIQRLFPKRKWTFVPVPDLCGNISNKATAIADSFVRAGALHVDDSSSI